MSGYRLLTEKEVSENNFLYRFNMNIEDNKGIKALKFMEIDDAKIYVGNFILQIDDERTYINENRCIPNHVCCINADGYRIGDIEKIKLSDAECESSAKDVCIFVRKNVRFDK